MAVKYYHKLNDLEIVRFANALEAPFQVLAYLSEK